MELQIALFNACPGNSLLYYLQIHTYVWRHYCIQKLQYF